MRKLVSFGMISAVAVAGAAVFATRALAAHPLHPGNPKSHSFRQAGAHEAGTRADSSRLHRRHKSEPPAAGSVNPVL